MPHRVAYVRFTKSGDTYPVNCNRADLSRDDIVVVEMSATDTLKVARVDRIDFQNWNCSNSIICRRSEYEKSLDGGYRVNRLGSRPPFPETIAQLGNRLIAAGWKSYEPASKAWRSILGKAFLTHSASIVFRKNGIDFQFFDTPILPVFDGNKMSYSPGSHGTVRNWFYYAGEDLVEKAWNFSQELESDVPEIAKFFEQAGRRPPKRANFSERDDLGDIRQAINGGMGGPAYLCDGVWI